MFIGHLPAGYICSRYMLRIRRGLDTKTAMIVGMAASVLPDLDLFYFYLIDGRQTLHHEYWTHTPIFWVAILGLALLLSPWFRGHGLIVAGLIVCANGLLHLVLDTIAGGIAWLYPYSTASFVLFNVPAVHGWWVWNFILHWTFALEIAVCLWAAVLFVRDRRPAIRAIGG